MTTVRTMNLAGIGEVLRQIALFHCPEEPAGALPEPDVTKIMAWVHSVTPAQQITMTDGNMLRLRALMEPRNYAALMHLPEQLLLKRAAPPKAEDKSKKRALKPRDRALLALYAVALEILIFCPLRRDNLTCLRLGQNLRRARPGGSITDIYLSAAEVKNKKPIHWPVPPESAQLIELYLRQHRPLLTEPDNTFLFPNSGLGHRAPHDLAVGLTKRVERDIGVEFNLHLMRHLAVLVYLNEHPGQYEVVSRILGHRKVETTKTFYAGLELDAAVRRFLETITAKRKGTRLLANGRGGKLWIVRGTR